MFFYNAFFCYKKDDNIDFKSNIDSFGWLKNERFKKNLRTQRNSRL